MLNVTMMLETAVDPLMILDSVLTQKVLTIFCKVKKPRINPPDSRFCISLTLTSLMSERASQVEGGLLEPPYLSWLWSQIQSKDHDLLKGDINSNTFDPLLEYFFNNSVKN